MRLYAVVALIAAVVTLVLSFVIYKLAMRYRWYPKIRARDVHRRPTPRLGGIAMFLGMAAAVGVAALIRPFFDLVFDRSGPIWALATAAIIITLLGVFDDIYELGWLSKLAGQIIAAGVLAWQGVAINSVPFGSVIVGSSWLSLIITVLIIVGVMNAVNFIDGLDGLVAGVTIIANAIFLTYSYLLSSMQGSQTERFNLAALVSAVTLGACLGFLPINWNPAKMFMGDSGALLVGLMMATSAVAVTGEIDPSVVDRSEILPAYLPIFLPFLILIIPVLDFSLAVVRRVRAGKSPFSADRKHLHHRLLDMGHSTKQAVMIFYGWTLIVGVSALLIFAVEPIWWGVGVFVVGFIACAVLTIAPISRRKRRERRAQRAEGRRARQIVEYDALDTGHIPVSGLAAGTSAQPDPQRQALTEPERTA